MSDLSTGYIYDAIEALSREADRLSWNAAGWEQRERARDLKRIVERARPEYRALSDRLPRMRALLAEADQLYDRYVTRDRDHDAEGCSCHINPPCGFCTRQSEEDEAA